MIIPGIAYFIKVNLALILFYGFYRLFFYKDTFFLLRRTLLLAFLGVAFLYPLLDIHDWIQKQEPIAEVISLYSVFLPEVTVTQDAVPDWKSWLAGIVFSGYIAGCLLLTVRFFIQLGNILLLAGRCKQTEIDGTRVSVLDKPGGPFSFFNFIFIHPGSHSGKERAEILMHEKTHAAQYHSVDVLACELAAIICWINPFAWLLKREVRHNLEYLADQVVIHAGYDRKSYQYHLLGLAHHQGMTELYNNFNVLHLKNRISMMNKKRSRGIIRTKYLLFFPLAAGLMLLSNIEAVARVTESFLKEKIPGTNRVEGDIRIKGKVVDQENQPIIGANVVIKGTTSGTITDLDGNFILVTPADAVIQISFATGYKAKEANAKDFREGGTVKLEAATSPVKDQLFTVVEKMPVYPGGIEALQKQIAANIRYPRIAYENGIQGRVVCSFVINKDGTISDVSIVRGVDPALDKEAIRVIETLPGIWEPGEQRGHKVRVKYTIPILFDIKKGTVSESYLMPPKKNVWCIVDGKEMTYEQFEAGYTPDQIESMTIKKGDTAVKEYGEKAKDGIIIVVLKK